MQHLWILWHIKLTVWVQVYGVTGVPRSSSSEQPQIFGNYTPLGKVKVKVSHYRPLGFQKVEAPKFLDNRHMKVVRLSALRTGRLYPQEELLVLISVRG